MKTSKPMKTSKQDIQDLLSQLAADIEEIKAMLSSSAGVVADTTTANTDRIIAEINRLLEPIAQTCGKLSGRLKSYYAQLLLRIPKDLREELTRDNDTRKRKGLPTIENKIDNSLTMLVSIYDRLNQIEDAMLPDTPQQGQTGRIQSANGKSAKSGITAVLKSALAGVQRLWAKRPTRWYRDPYILCVVIIYLLYFGLSIVSWTQWHRYRDENARLRLTADKYRVDSIILREVYPQVAITLSAYEHIIESEGADAAMQTFWDNNK